MCSNPETGAYPQRDVCWVTAVAELARRRRNEIVGADPATNELGFEPDDGAVVWASTHDLTPDDDFLEQPRFPQKQKPSEGW